VPALAPHAVGLSLALVALLTVVNLRGVKESGRAFAVPTYGFVTIVLLLLAVAGLRLAMGATLTAESASYGLVGDHRTGGLLTVFRCSRPSPPRTSPSTCPPPG
jgi:amino acid transporter